MGCGGSSSAVSFFETTKVLKLPASLESAGEVEAFDYILSTFMSAAVIAQLPLFKNAFEAQGGVIAHRLSGQSPPQPQSYFYETKHRTNNRMQIEVFGANGTISDPASVKEQVFSVTIVDISLKRTNDGVQTYYSVGQPTLNVPGGALGVRVIKPLLLRVIEQEFAAREQLYAKQLVPLPAAAGGA